MAVQSGITQESLARFERGHVSEFGSRKLLAVLAVLGMSFTLLKRCLGALLMSCAESGVVYDALNLCV
ncbi:hypothetical protein [Mycoavidus sp. SF9855]|uniref:hypothetical protein n=1 Tax=Mycoavidus sp. SF9855 TaxID=2968475 RepID=UPI00211BDF91|nr:hypothetical protein [Mycoavidus sp. SF9855]UUM22191.1 hypothetical protein NQD60_03675 [Mycoavidus sp. SF9855]